MSRRSNKPLHFSRREFLTLAAASAAAGHVSAAPASPKPPQSATATIGPAAVPIELRVNGKSLKLEAEPRVTLLDALRDRLMLTGTKRACDHGACGACTVLLDAKPVYACLLLAVAVQGREIRTVEGLAASGQLTPVQRAFIEEDAMMCGFCTPGFVMSATALLQENPNPAPGQVKAGLAGNLCRCGAYNRICSAVARAARGEDR